MAEEPAVDDLVERVRSAAASATPLCIRGGGSKDFYGATVGRPQGEPLSTLALAGIVSYEPTELVVTVRAGTALAELEALLAQENQHLPFEPPHFGDADHAATVGGMVAAGLSGPSRASSGAVRDFVLGARMVNGRGELLTFGGQVMKNVAGYDVSRVLAGSLGVLGVIVDVSLKVLPRPPLEATLRFEMSQREALERLNRWGGQPLPLNASCWLEEEGTACLYLRLRGAVAAVESACERLGGERLGDTARVARDWADCREQRLPWFAQRGAERDLWRLSVPQTAPPLDLPEAPLIEWHGGQRWVRVGRGDAQAARRLRQAVAGVGGHATLFVAADADSGGPQARFDPVEPPLDRIQRNLKREFDPEGIFNPARLSPEF